MKYFFDWLDGNNDVAVFLGLFMVVPCCISVSYFAYAIAAVMSGIEP